MDAVCHCPSATVSRCRFAGCVPTISKSRGWDNRVIQQVALPHLKIKTTLDGIGVDRRGGVVVIELKCTSFQLAQHSSRYRTPCRKKRMLSFIDGVPNSEETAHQLQTAFGILGLRRCLPRTAIRGVVVVCASDGAVLHEVKPKFVQERWFAFHTAVPQRPHRDVSFPPLPEGENRTHIISLLAPLGFTILQPRLKSLGSVVLRNKEGDLLIAAIVHVKSPTAAVGKDRIAQLKKDATTLWTRRRKAVAVYAYFIKHTADGSAYALEKVRHHRRK